MTGEAGREIIVRSRKADDMNRRSILFLMIQHTRRNEEKKASLEKDRVECAFQFSHHFPGALLPIPIPFCVISVRTFRNVCVAVSYVQTCLRPRTICIVAPAFLIEYGG